jgi:hypothetical protein
MAGNNCGTFNTIGYLATQLGPAANGVGLDADQVNVTFASGPGLANQITCNPLSTCFAAVYFDSPYRFPDGPNHQDSAIGLPVSISIRYPLTTALAMFWPGNGGGWTFAPILLGASSQDFVQY